MTTFQPGDECYVIADSQRGSWTKVSAKRTVERVTKTLVVLDDGTKFNRERLSIRHGGTWDSWCEYLITPDDPRLNLARQSIARSNRVARIRAIASDLDDAVRVGRWNDARKHAFALAEKLVEHTDA
jgi:hypothetical protein